MPARAALVTGASSGIGLALARMLGEEGYAVTLTARREEKLAAAAEQLRAEGHEVAAVALGLHEDGAVERLVAAHRERFGRLDVLCNNAGIGIGAAVEAITPKGLDLQIGVNLRAVLLLHRECAGMLRAAGAEHRRAWIVNTASIAGKSGQPWLSVYSATKAGVIAFTQAMNRELGADGVRAVALCPAFVDTPMTDYVKEHVAPEEMITTGDVATMVRALLALSPACMIEEIVMRRRSEAA